MITHPARLLHGADNYEIITVRYKTSLEVCEPVSSLVVVLDFLADCGDEEDRSGHRLLIYYCIIRLLGGLHSTETGLNKNKCGSVSQLHTSTVVLAYFFFPAT